MLAGSDMLDILIFVPTANVQLALHEMKCLRMPFRPRVTSSESTERVEAVETDLAAAAYRHWSVR